MIFINLVGACWFLGVSFFICWGVLIFGGDEERMPLTARMSNGKKVTSTIVASLIFGACPWFISWLVFKTFVFGW